MSELKQGDREFRIRGRITTQSDLNNFYPKFILDSEVPFLYRTIFTSEEFDGIPLDERVYEPLYKGLGVTREIMYVKTGLRTFLFSVPVVQEILWGSKLVKFSDDINFKGEIVT